MTRYEFIKMAESVLKVCDREGIAPSEAAYLPVYEEWIRLTGEGHKKVWIIAYLAQQYGISEATIKRITKKFAKWVKP